MAITLRVCRGTSCGSYGRELLRDLEDLCDGQAVVQPRRCMGRCGGGPNVEILKMATSEVQSAVSKFASVEQLVSKHVKAAKPDSVEKRIGALKFQARRAKDAGEKAKLVEQAFQCLESGQKASSGKRGYSKMRGQLLLLRAQVAGDGSTMAARIKDAEAGATLLSSFARPHIQLADLYAEADRPNYVAAALKKALQVGTGIGQDERLVIENRISGLKDQDKEEPLVSWIVAKKVQLNHNCVLVALENSDLQLEYSRGGQVTNLENLDTWHVDLQAVLNGSPVFRAYTPSSSLVDLKVGRLELMVKVYPDGAMSSHVGKLRSGDTILVSAPTPTIDASQFGDGVVVIAGGSAITVALQVCAVVLDRRAERADVRLVLCNRTEADIVFQDRLNDMQKRYPAFVVTHCLSQGDPAHKQLTAALEAVGPSVDVVISGPPGLCRVAYAHLRAARSTVQRLHVLDDLASDSDLLSPPKSEVMEKGGSKGAAVRAALGGDADEEEPSTSLSCCRCTKSRARPPP